MQAHDVEDKREVGKRSAERPAGRQPSIFLKTRINQKLTKRFRKISEPPIVVLWIGRKGMRMSVKARLELDEHSLITSELIKAHGSAAEEVADHGELTEHAARLAIVLDLAHQGFASGEPAAAIVHRLAGRLHEIRRQTAPAVWRQLIPVAQQHRVAEYLLQDPFTRWSFEKPRGYSGDASLLDIYYKHRSADEIIASSTPLGREIYAYTSDAASSVAGRERRDILAKTVDDTARRVGRAEVLAIACGHLREAELSQALAGGKLQRWVGLDQDPISVGTVNRDIGGTGVEAIDGSVRGILRRAYKLGTFDLVYASGLYDYLPRAIGIRLLQRAMELVKPGGEFLFANFSDEITTDGYMETFMDWPLILRSADDMWDIINSALDRNSIDAQVYYGSNRNIVYGMIRKRPLEA
jgi:SAM-dependent methyltransferase